MEIRSQWKRLASKPLGELGGRAAAAWRERFERAQFETGWAARPNRLERALGSRPRDAAELLGLRRSSRPPFMPSLACRDRMRSLVAERYSQDLALTRGWASRAFDHEFHFFGRVHRLRGEVPWQSDPVTGRQWPRAFWGDIPSAGGDAGYGDVKDVWELSRQQFLIDLGKSYFLEEVGAHSAEIRHLVRSWIAGNPYATGVNWASPLEPAYRAFSWLWAYYFTLDDPDFDADDHYVWLEGFLDHGRFLHRHLELWASPFNHLIGEATALYLLGVLFPEFGESAAWRRRGRHVLETRLPQQFYADGGSVEQATLYHHATLGFYLLAALVGRANGEEFPRAVWSAIERAIEFSMLLVQPDGRLPVIGDTDDARPIQLERKPFFDFRAYQAVGAVLFGRGDFKVVAGRFHEDALWLLGPDGLDAFDRLPSESPARTSVALKDSGYFVFRNDWSSNGDYVCFDCGEQAGGLRTDDIPSAAHGHADCLSVIIFLRGRPVLVDSGFYTYNGDKRWERHLRETAAHNTARVDALDQARHLEKMAWTEVPTPRLERWANLEDQGYVVGSHDGFLRKTGVVHRRYVWYRPGGYVVLFDEFDGQPSHDIEVSFHFAPGETTLRGNSVAGTDVSMYWTASYPVIVVAATGEDGPEGGWVAPSLGIRIAAPVVRVSGRMAHRGAGLLTAIVPEDYQVVGTESNGSTLRLSIEGPDWLDDVVAVPSGFAAAHPPLKPLAIVRRRNGIVVEERSIENPPGSSGTNP
jgi:hypothetical protein